MAARRFNVGGYPWNRYPVFRTVTMCTGRAGFSSAVDAVHEARQASRLLVDDAVRALLLILGGHTPHPLRTNVRL